MQHDGFKSRKFCFAIFILIVATLLVALAKLPADAYQAIVIADIFAYIGGNIGERLAAKTPA